MAIVYNNKEYRNLQQQVAENMKNIKSLQDLTKYGIVIKGYCMDEEHIEVVDPEPEVGDVVGVGYPLELYVYGPTDDSWPSNMWYSIGQYPLPGPQGPEGPQGPRGIQGATGAQGPTGPRGLQGPQGVAGPKGDTGAQGETGYVSSFVPDEESVTEVGQAYVDEDGHLQVCTALDPLTFEDAGSIKGPQGEQGIQGIQGIQGETGAQGPQGPEGPEGPQGPEGEPGEDGTIVSGTDDGTNWTSLTIDGVTHGFAAGGGAATWGSITGTLSNQTDLQTALNAKANSVDLATVATSGSYNDLTNKPTIPVVDYPVTDVQVDGTSVLDGTVAKITSPDLSDYVTSTELGTALADYTETSDLAAVALSNDYDDLDDKPDLSIYAESADLATVATTGDYTDLINTPDLSDMATETWVGQQGYLTSVSWSDVSNKPTFATVATSGDYDDLIDKPDLSIYAESSDLATVATTGDYDDLLNKPTIPAAQVNSDWNAVSGVAQILNKPTIPVVPTNVSAFTNDAGYITSSDIPVTDVQVDGASVVSSKVASITLPALTLTDTAYASPDYALKGLTINGEKWNIDAAPSNYVTTDTAQIITGNKTLKGVGLYFQQAAGSTNYASLYLNGSTFQMDAPNMEISSSNGVKVISNLLTGVEGTGGGDKDIGSSTRRWKDLYLSGNISDGTNSIAVANIANKTNSETWTFTLSDDTTVAKTVVLG